MKQHAETPLLPCVLPRVRRRKCALAARDNDTPLQCVVLASGRWPGQARAGGPQVRQGPDRQANRGIRGASAGVRQEATSLRCWGVGEFRRLRHGRKSQQSAGKAAGVMVSYLALPYVRAGRAERITVGFWSETPLLPADCLNVGYRRWLHDASALL